MYTLCEKNELIVSDVDDTIAPVYLPASSEMIEALSKILAKGIRLILLSGQGYQNIYDRVVSFLPEKLRHRILIGHCHGAEVLGFDAAGKKMSAPFFSVRQNELPLKKIERWHDLIDEIRRKFKLISFPPMPLAEFRTKTQGSPYAIMFDDREIQITFDVANGYDLLHAEKDAGIDVYISRNINDLRIPISEYAENLFATNRLPIQAKLSGEFAVDFVTRGISKGEALKRILSHVDILAHLNLDPNILGTPEKIQIWGDQFSLDGNSDVSMCEALPNVQAINFRKIAPEKMVTGYNIKIWDREKELCEGLVEYLGLAAAE